MPTFTVNDDLISSLHAERYFLGADRRVMMGLRTALEMLSLPVPDYAKRRKPGATPAKATLAAYNQDNPAPRFLTAAERKPNASPERIAAVETPRSPSPAANLFDQVFPG